MEPNRQQRTRKTLDANRQYRVDAEIKQTVKSSLWNQTDSTEYTWESNKQYRADYGTKQTI